MKKMNRNVLMVAVATLALASCGSPEAPATDATTAPTGPTGPGIHTVDTENSEVEWKGTMLKIKSHTGTLHFVEGELTTNDGALSGGTFTVDMKSYTFTDTNYTADGSEGGTRAQLMGHLMSPDFFAVDSFPTAKFTITSVEGNTATGDLTIRGRTQQEQVKNISLSHDGDKLHATGELTFNRKNYNVRWDSPMQDAVLSDDIELKVHLMATKN